MCNLYKNDYGILNFENFLLVAFMKAGRYTKYTKDQGVRVGAEDVHSGREGRRMLASYGMTIYDIATLAGVSISTVSRVINGNTNVNTETREKVEAIVQKYGFVPKQSARNFHRRNLSAVGLMMNDIRNPYMSGLAYTINRELSKQWVNTVLCNILDVEIEFINQLDHLIERKVDGVILMGSIFQHPLCKVALERKYSGFPFVAINSNLALPNVCELILDQKEGIRTAVEYLYGLGKRAIGYIYRQQSASDSKKYEGYIQGMQHCGLKPVRTQIIQSKSMAEGYEATKQLIHGFPDVDAIIYSADLLAVGGVHFLSDVHVHIPDQIAVIGFNNSTSTLECYPAITSIDNNMEASGVLAVSMMMRLINRLPIENVHIPCSLVVRETTELNTKKREER